MGAISKRASELEFEMSKIGGGVDLVGEGLRNIRDRHLYLETHDTFDNFCRECFGWSRSYVHRMIEAWEVRQSLLPIGNTAKIPKAESQLREVAKAPEEKRAEVVEKAHEIAEDEGREPTAKDYKQARQIVVEEGEYEDVEDDDQESGKPAKAAEEKPKPVKDWRYFKAAAIANIEAAGRAISDASQSKQFPNKAYAQQRLDEAWKALRDWK